MFSRRGDAAPHARQNRSRALAAHLCMRGAIRSGVSEIGLAAHWRNACAASA